MGPLGSPFTRVAQVFVAAGRKWRVSETHSGWGICYEEMMNGAMVESLGRTDQFRYAIESSSFL